MILNTKTGKITVTKTEQRQLKTALGILANLEQHGDAEMSRHAQAGCEAIQEVFDTINPVPVEAPPY